MAITLTNAISMLDILGGVATVDYSTFKLTRLNVDTIQNSANGTLQLTSGAASRPAIAGSISIFTASNPRIEIEFSELGHFKTKVLSAAQVTSIVAVFQALKNDVENGLVSIALVDGIQG